MIQTVKIKKLVDDAKIPTYATDGSAGFDLYSVEDTIIIPKSQKLIPTGVSVKIPDDQMLLIMPRSGLALKHQITITNSPGLLDSDYIGPLGVIVYNLGDTDFVIKKGDRIAQGVLTPFSKAYFLETDDLGETARGTGGFGSTGK